MNRSKLRDLFSTIFVQQKYPVITFMILGFLLALPGLLLLQVPERDCINRYIPMTKAFAQGNWAYAFHPRVPPLTYLLSGGLACLGISAYNAIKLTSLIFWLVGIYPFHRIWHKISGKKIAWFSCLLYIFCSKLLTLSFSGLRATTKSTSLLFLAWGLILVYQQRKSWKGYIITSLAAVGLLLVRGDCAIFALAGLLAALIFNSRHFGKFVLPLKSLACILLCIVLISPWLAYIYKTTGYPTTEYRLSILLDSSLKKVGLDNLYNNDAKPGIRNKNPKLTEPQNTNIEIIRKFKHASPLSLGSFFSKTSKGLFHVFFIFTCLGIYLRIKNRFWKPSETILLSLFSFHCLMIVLQIYFMYKILFMDYRYLITSIPLTLGWSVFGLYATIKWIIAKSSRSQRVHVKRLIFAAFCTGAVFVYISGISPLKQEYIKKKDRTKFILQVAKAISEIGKPEQQNSSFPQLLDNYCINSKYSIASTSTRASGLADYRWTPLAKLNTQEAIEYYKSSDIKFFIVKDSEQKHFKNNPFEQIYKSNNLKDNFTIYKISRN